MFLVVFRNRTRDDIDVDSYFHDTIEIEALAAAQPGFRSFRSFAADDGEVLTLSEWDSAAHAHAWARHAGNAAFQRRGVAE